MFSGAHDANTYAAMRNAPETKTGLRPIWSTHITAGTVAMAILHILHEYESNTGCVMATYTMPTTPVANSETVLPVRPRDVKMDGA